MKLTDQDTSTKSAEYTQIPIHLSDTNPSAYTQCDRKCKKPV
jgi:hypothetical protein